MNLSEAINRSEEVARVISGATRTYYSVLTDAKHRKPGYSPSRTQRDTEKRRAEGTGVHRAYWSSLDIPFRHLLKAVHDDEELLRWFDVLGHAARRAMESLVFSREIGVKQEYEARAVAKRFLNGGLKRVLDGAR